MPLVTRWRRLPLSIQWATVCALLLIIIASLTIAVVSLMTSKNVGRCVNNSLGGERSVKSQQYDNAITDAFDLFGKALNGQVDGNDPAVRKQFIADVETIRAVKAYRQAHQLGQC